MSEPSSKEAELSSSDESRFWEVELEPPQPSPIARSDKASYRDELGLSMEENMATSGREVEQSKRTAREEAVIESEHFYVPVGSFDYTYCVT